MNGLHEKKRVARQRGRIDRMSLLGLDEPLINIPTTTTIASIIVKKMKYVEQNDRQLFSGFFLPSSSLVNNFTMHVVESLRSMSIYKLFEAIQ